MYLRLFLVLIAVSYGLASEQDVLEYGDSDFNTRIAEHETALVMFYAPWWVFLLIRSMGDGRTRMCEFFLRVGVDIAND